jgi:hypothetical protein
MRAIPPMDVEERKKFQDLPADASPIIILENAKLRRSSERHRQPVEYSLSA